jgi:lipopolysaccharide/colanic/teichoic acid biosynthesis glycosyltransferase
MLRKWDNLPRYMQTEAVSIYYESLRKKKAQLVLKRSFDFIAATAMIIILFPIMLLISILIITDSKGSIFFCQERITQYGRKFCIYKFRTMVVNAERIGAHITAQYDNRVTKIGRILRKYRLDELPQLINIILGDMSFCGTRPESTYFVKKYTPEMFATLLLPAGVTSEASILFKDEDELLGDISDLDQMYVEQILPKKMEYNLDSILHFSLIRDIKTMIRTILVIIR